MIGDFALHQPGKPKPLGEWKAHQMNYPEPFLAPDGRFMLTQTVVQTVFWDLTTGKHEVVSTAQSSRPSGAISDNGRFVAVRLQGRIRVWDRQTATPAILRGHATYVYFVDFSEDGRTLVSRDDWGGIRIWDARDYQGCGLFTQYVGLWKSPAEGNSWDHYVRTEHALSPDGSRFVVADSESWLAGDLAADTTLTHCKSNFAQVWQILRQATGRTIAGQKFAVSPDGRIVVTAVGEVLDADTGTRLRVLEGCSLKPEFSVAQLGASFSPSGKRVVIANKSARVHDVAWSPDGIQLSSDVVDPYAGDLRLTEPPFARVGSAALRSDRRVPRVRRIAVCYRGRGSGRSHSC